jgi:hypothetical protein
VERSEYEFSKTVPMGDARCQQAIATIALEHGGGIDRASPQSTLNCPTSGALHTLQQIETRKHKSPTKPRLLTTQIQRQRSRRGVVLQSVSQRLRSFIADYIGYRHTRVERSKYEFSKPVPMGDAANGQSQQSQQAHSIYGDIDRASPQPTLYSPTSGAVHTLQQKKPGNTNHQRNQDYSHFKFSNNEVTVVLFFSVSPNAFAPSSPILLPTDTPEWRDPNTNSANQFQRATLPTGNHNNRTRYMVVLIVPLHNRTLNSPTSVVSVKNETRQITNQTKNTHIPNSTTTKSAWCCPSERSPTPSLLHRRFYCLQRHTRVERFTHEFSKPVPMDDTDGKTITTITTSALDIWGC